MHLLQGPFFTCPRRCALAEGCKNEQQHAGFHMSCSLLGDGLRGVCPCGNGKCKDFAATPVVACVQMGEASKTRNATTKARRSTISIHTGVLASNHASQPTVRRARGSSSATRKHSKNACALAEWLYCCWPQGLGRLYASWGDLNRALVIVRSHP